VQGSWSNLHHLGLIHQGDPPELLSIAIPTKAALRGWPVIASTLGRPVTGEQK